MKNFTRYLSILPLLFCFASYIKIHDNSNKPYHNTTLKNHKVLKKKSNNVLTNNNEKFNSNDFLNSSIKKKKALDDINKKTTNIYIENPSNLNYTFTITYWAYNMNQQLQKYTYFANNNSKKYLLTGNSDQYKGVATSKLFDMKVHINSINQPNIGVCLFPKYKDMITLNALYSSSKKTSYYISAIGILTCPNISLYQHNINSISKNNDFIIGQYNVYNFYNSTGEWSIPLMSIITPIIMLKLFQITVMSITLAAIIYHWDWVEDVLTNSNLLMRIKNNYARDVNVGNSNKPIINSDSHINVDNNANIQKEYDKSIESESAEIYDQKHTESQSVVYYDNVNFVSTLDKDDLVYMGNNNSSNIIDDVDGYDESSISDIRYLFIYDARDIDASWDSDFKAKCFQYILPNIDKYEYEFTFELANRGQGRNILQRYSDDLDKFIGKRNRCHSKFLKDKEKFESMIAREDRNFNDTVFSLLEEIKMEKQIWKEIVKHNESYLSSTESTVTPSSVGNYDSVFSTSSNISHTYTPILDERQSFFLSYKNKLLKYHEKRIQYCEFIKSRISNELCTVSESLSKMQSIKYASQIQFNHYLSDLQIYIEGYNKWYVDFDDNVYYQMIKSQLPDDITFHDFVDHLNTTKKNVETIIKTNKIEKIKSFTSGSTETRIDAAIKEIESHREQLTSLFNEVKSEIKLRKMRINWFHKIYSRRIWYRSFRSYGNPSATETIWESSEK